MPQFRSADSTIETPSGPRVLWEDTSVTITEWMLRSSSYALADDGAARLLCSLQGAARLTTDQNRSVFWSDPGVVHVPPARNSHLAADGAAARVLEIAAASRWSARRVPELVALGTVPLAPMPEQGGFRAASARWFNGSAGPSIVALAGQTIYGPMGRHELHRHPEVAEILYVISGRGAHLWHEGSRAIGPGDLVAVEIGEWHGFVAGPDGADVAVIFPGVTSVSEIPSELFSPAGHSAPAPAN